MRDDFTAGTKKLLKQRVSSHCSNPSCYQQTDGPAIEGNRAITIGIAAHIAGAAPGGPRYDSSMTSEKRSSIDNGIWLCTACSTIIDADPVRYPVSTLQEWKTSAELRAHQRLTGTMAEIENKVQLQCELKHKGYYGDGTIHEYDLKLYVKNIGQKIVREIIFDVRMPIAPIRNIENLSEVRKIDSASGYCNIRYHFNGSDLMLLNGDEINFPLFSYFMDNKLYWGRQLDQMVVSYQIVVPDEFQFRNDIEFKDLHEY